MPPPLPPRKRAPMHYGFCRRVAGAAPRRLSRRHGNTVAAPTASASAAAEPARLDAAAATEVPPHSGAPCSLDAEKPLCAGDSEEPRRPGELGIGLGDMSA